MVDSPRDSSAVSGGISRVCCLGLLEVHLLTRPLPNSSSDFKLYELPRLSLSGHHIT